MRRLALALALAALSGCAAAPAKPGAPLRRHARITGDAEALALPAVDGTGEREIPSPGRVTVIDLWATWCEPCIESLPLLDELHGRLSPAGVDVIGVSIDAEREPAAAFAARHGLRLPLLWDPDARSISSWVTVGVVPTTLVLDCAGEVRHVHEGYEGPADLRALEERLGALAGEPACN